MKQLTKLFLISIICIVGANSCSTFSPFQVPILQGNIIQDKDVAQLAKGLTRDQVQYLLGTPLLSSPLHPKRWDYFYSIKVGEQTLGEKKLSLFFNAEERLDSWILEEASVGED